MACFMGLCMSGVLSHKPCSGKQPVPEAILLYTHSTLSSKSLFWGVEGQGQYWELPSWTHACWAGALLGSL
jgi:hypothetical protein